MAARKFPRKRTNWLKLAGLWRRSGQTVAAFCRQRGLNPSGLYASRRRFRSEMTVKGNPEGTAEFVPVTVVPSTAVASAPVLEIELSNGRLLRLRGELTPVRLAAIVRALEGGAC